MKEIMKNICNSSLKKAYEQNLNYTFTTFFNDYKNPEKFKKTYNRDLNNLVKNVLLEVLENLVAKDFTVNKIVGNLDILREVKFHPLMGNFETEITVFYIEEKDCNVVIIDPFLENCFRDEEIILIIEEYIKEINKNYIPEYNNENSEIYKKILYADDTMVCSEEGFISHPESFEYKQTKYTALYNLIDVLVELYGDNPKTEGYRKIIHKYLLELNKIVRKDMCELYYENKDKVLSLLIPLFIDRVTFELDDAEKQKITNYLFNEKDIDKIVKLMFTFQYVNRAYNKFCSANTEDIHYAPGFLDFSFIAVVMFKLVEIIFYNLLNKFWSESRVRDKYGDIDFSKDSINLGKMEQFFKSNEMEIVHHLHERIKYNELLQTKLTQWIQKTRNGFLHRHILSDLVIENSVSDSIDIMCLLILTLIK